MWTELILRELTQQRIEQHVKVEKYFQSSSLVLVSKTILGEIKACFLLRSYVDGYWAEVCCGSRSITGCVSRHTGRFAVADL